MRNVLITSRPVPQGSMSVFNGRVVHSRGKDLKAYRDLIASVAAQSFPEPLRGGVRVELRFILPTPKSRPRVLPHVRPDLDKLVRAVLDGLTGVAYVDDAQVTSLTAVKRYGGGAWVEQGVWITVQTEEWSEDAVPSV
jgi:crossover junction endodeoxyribonuclease RusA